MKKKVLDTVICPGCGWSGSVQQLSTDIMVGSCPNCEYENGAEPYRLLTIEELIGTEFEDTEYHDVRFDLFLKSLFKLLEVETE
jgi:hypothetical protein